MTALVMCSLVALVFLWITWSWVKMLFHDVDDGVAYVEKRLKRAIGTEATVGVWESRPLTAPQIKELAESKGFRFRQGSSRGSVGRSLVFERGEHNV